MTLALRLVAYGTAALVLVSIAIGVFNVLRPWLRRLGAPDTMLNAIATGLDAIRQIARVVVGAAQQTEVRERKDPATASTWTPDDQAAVKARVAGQVHAIAAPVEAQLREAGMPAATIAAFVDHAVEDSVREMKTTAPKAGAPNVTATATATAGGATATVTEQTGSDS